MNVKKIDKYRSVPKYWLNVRIDDVCDIIGGGTPSRNEPEYFGGDLVWLTPTEINKEKIQKISNSKEKITKIGLQKSSARIIPKNSVLLTTRASIGHVAIAGTQVTTNQGFTSFVCSENIYNYFLAYWLWGNKKLLIEKATGTTFKEISKSTIRKLNFYIPSINEQRRIVSKIESIFSQIDAATEIIEPIVRPVTGSLAILRNKILKQAFEGTLVHQNSDDESASMLLYQITNKYLKNNKNVDYQTKNIPKNWILTTIGNICTKPQYGWTTSATKNGNLHLLRTSDITSSTFNWDTVPFCKEEPKDINKYLLHDGDIVISRAGSVGFSHLIVDPPESIFASYLIRFKPFINKQFFSYFLQSPFYWKAISEKSIGIALANVNATKLSRIPIPVPPLSEQGRIVVKIESIFAKIDSVDKIIKLEIKRLQDLKQSILKQAFEGRLISQDPNDKPVRLPIEKAERHRKMSKKNRGVDLD